MAQRRRAATWAGIFQRNLKLLTGPALRAGRAATTQALKSQAQAARPPPGEGDWLAGMVVGPAGIRHYRVFRPAGLRFSERVPLLVMLHGCGQDAKSFAVSTRMNRVATRERFVVLYPQQSRLANAQGCWNWFDTDSGRAYAEAGVILKAIDQVCLLYPVDRARVALAGLSAGASMAGLLAVRHADRFKAVVMHSGIPPGAAHSPLSAIGAMQGRRTAYKAPARRPGSPPAGGLPWPPLLVIHGVADATVSVDNGRLAAHAWAAAAGAQPVAARQVQRGQRHAMAVTDFNHGAATVARLVEVAGLGHAWSGGATGQAFSDGRGPDASRLAWSFIAKALRG